VLLLLCGLIVVDLSTSNFACTYPHPMLPFAGSELIYAAVLRYGAVGSDGRVNC
jgi:hypothetical protein